MNGLSTIEILVCEKQNIIWDKLTKWQAPHLPYLLYQKMKCLILSETRQEDGREKNSRGCMAENRGEQLEERSRKRSSMAWAHFEVHNSVAHWKDKKTSCGFELLQFSRLSFIFHDLISNLHIFFFAHACNGTTAVFNSYFFSMLWHQCDFVHHLFSHATDISKEDSYTLHSTNVSRIVGCGAWYSRLLALKDIQVCFQVIVFWNELRTFYLSLPSDLNYARRLGV